MNKKTYPKIIGIIEDLELTENLIYQLKSLEGEPLNKIAFAQIERKKRNLIKELLKEMITANLSFRHFETLYQKIFLYLKAGESKEQLPQKIQSDVNRAVQFLAT